MWLWANDITTAWRGLPNGTLSMMFTCCPNLMLLASLWLEIYRFQIGHFATLSSSKLIFILLTLGKSKLSLFVFLLTVDRSQLLYSVWVRHAAENNPNPLCLIKIQKTRIGFGASYFQWFNQWKSRTGFLSQ